MRNVAAVLALIAAPLVAQNLSFGSREARRVPDWPNRASVYELWLNAFSEEGTLRGAIPLLPHIADLGATIVYLGPIAAFHTRRRTAWPNTTPSTRTTATSRTCATSSPRRLNFTLDGIPFLYNGQEFGDRTRWIEPAPLDWQSRGITADIKESKTTPERYKALVHARSSHPALYSGELIWVNNSEPQSVLSFLRKKGDEEALVPLNLSNRKVHVYIDLPVMEYLLRREPAERRQDLVRAVFGPRLGTSRRV